MANATHTDRDKPLRGSHETPAPEADVDKHPVPDNVRPPADASEMSVARSAARDELVQLRAKIQEMNDIAIRISARFGMS